MIIQAWRGQVRSSLGQSRARHAGMGRPGYVPTRAEQGTTCGHGGYVPTRAEQGMTCGHGEARLCPH